MYGLTISEKVEAGLTLFSMFTDEQLEIMIETSRRVPSIIDALHEREEHVQTMPPIMEIVSYGNKNNPPDMQKIVYAVSLLMFNNIKSGLSKDLVEQIFTMVYGNADIAKSVAATVITPDSGVADNWFANAIPGMPGNLPPDTGYELLLLGGAGMAAQKRFAGMVDTKEYAEQIIGITPWLKKINASAKSGQGGPAHMRQCRKCLHALGGPEVISAMARDTPFDVDEEEGYEDYPAGGPGYGGRRKRKRGRKWKKFWGKVKKGAKTVWKKVAKPLLGKIAPKILAMMPFPGARAAAGVLGATLGGPGASRMQRQLRAVSARRMLPARTGRTGGPSDEQMYLKPTREFEDTLFGGE
jgi:hypothetical protein